MKIGGSDAVKGGVAKMPGNLTRQRGGIAVDRIGISGAEDDHHFPARIVSDLGNQQTMHRSAHDVPGCSGPVRKGWNGPAKLFILIVPISGQ